MSGQARRLRRRRPKPFYAQVVEFERGRLTPRQAMLVAARAAGCTCQPDIVVSDIDRSAALYHDDWCAVVRQGDPS
jgi:hypothetical protein